MKVLIEYPSSGHLFKHYSKTRLYCPFCGEQGVWMCEDLPHGSTFDKNACVACKSLFTLPDLDNLVGVAGGMILKQLEAGITGVPNTPKLVL